MASPWNCGVFPQNRNTTRNGARREPAASSVSGNATTTGPSNAELKPFLDSPTTCEGPLSSSIEVQYYSGKVAMEEDAWPTSTGCDQLSFNPSLYAQPTTDGHRFALGARSRPQGSPAPEPHRALSLGDSRDDGDPAGGDGDQPQRRRRQDVLLRQPGSLRHRRRSPLSRVSQRSAPSVSPARRCRVQFQAPSISVSPSPAIATASFSPPTASPRTSNWPARSNPTPRRASSSSPSRIFPRARSRNSTFTSLAPNEVCSTTPTQCGTYPVTSTFTPWDAAAVRTDLHPVLHARQGPKRERLPGFDPSVCTPASKGRGHGRHGGAHSPFFVNLTRPDGDQTSHRPQRLDPPGLLRDPERHPLLFGRRARGRGPAQLLGPCGAGKPELPGRQPDRHRGGRRWERELTRSTSPARSTWRAPTRALHSASP